MKLHRNAKSTPSSRLLMVRRVLFEGWSYAAAAEGFAVSIRTVAKWVRRFKDGGIDCVGGKPSQWPLRGLESIVGMGAETQVRATWE